MLQMGLELELLLVRAPQLSKLAAPAVRPVGPSLFLVMSGCLIQGSEMK